MQTERTRARFLRFGHPRGKPGANLVRTCLVQVQRQLDCRLYLHVVLKEAAAERGGDEFFFAGYFPTFRFTGSLFSARGSLLPVNYRG